MVGAELERVTGREPRHHFCPLHTYGSSYIVRSKKNGVDLSIGLLGYGSEFFVSILAFDGIGARHTGMTQNELSPIRWVYAFPPLYSSSKFKFITGVFNKPSTTRWVENRTGLTGPWPTPGCHTHTKMSGRKYPVETGQSKCKPL